MVHVIRSLLIRATVHCVGHDVRTAWCAYGMMCVRAGYLKWSLAGRSMQARRTVTYVYKVYTQCSLDAKVAIFKTLAAILSLEGYDVHWVNSLQGAKLKGIVGGETPLSRQSNTLPSITNDIHIDNNLCRSWEILVFYQFILLFTRYKFLYIAIFLLKWKVQCR